jgi:hypothetical protein
VVCVAAARAEVSTASFWGGFGSGSPVGVGRELAVVAMVWSWALWRMELAGREAHLVTIKDPFAVRENMAGTFGEDADVGDVGKRVLSRLVESNLEQRR